MAIFLYSRTGVTPTLLYSTGTLFDIHSSAKGEVFRLLEHRGNLAVLSQRLETSQKEYSSGHWYMYPEKNMSVFGIIITEGLEVTATYSSFLIYSVLNIWEGFKADSSAAPSAKVSMQSIIFCATASMSSRV